MKAAPPKENDKSTKQADQKKKLQQAAPQREFEYANNQILQPSTSKKGTVGKGGDTSNYGGIPVVQSSQPAYADGSAKMYATLQESLQRTGDLNHPDTQKKEMDYMKTLGIKDLWDYQDMKSANTVAKSPDEQNVMFHAPTNKAENPEQPATIKESLDNEQSAISNEAEAEFLPQAAGGDGGNKDRVTHEGDVYTLHFDKYKMDEYGRDIDTNDKLDRYAERMIFGKEINNSWKPEYTDEHVQTLISNGTGISYRKSDYKAVAGGTGTGIGKKSAAETVPKPSQTKTPAELKSELAKLPAEIKKIIGTEKGNLSPTDYERLLAIAKKLKQLSPEDIAVFLRLNLKATDNIELFERTVDFFLLKKDQLRALSERTQAANAPKSMQEAVEGSWQGFDDKRIGKISENEQYDMAREQTEKATEAQLQYMKDHPGEVVKDFARSVTLMNTPETAEAIEKDIKEAANGDVIAWQRLAAGLGAGAKVSGWLLAVVCIVAVISMLTGVGEVAAMIEILLYTTVILSVAESEARIKAASQAKDPATFKENVNQAAAARTNVIVALAMLGLAKAVGFIAKTFFPKTLASIGESVKNFRGKLQKMVGLDKFDVMKAEFLTDLETNKQRLLQNGEQAKQNAARSADELAKMDTQTFVEKLDNPSDDFYHQAATQNGATANWKAMSQIPEGLKGIEAYKAALLEQLRTQVSGHIDQMVQEQVQAINKLQEGVKLAKDVANCDAAVQQYEAFRSPEEVTKRANAKQAEITKDLSEKALKDIEESLNTPRLEEIKSEKFIRNPKHDEAEFKRQIEKQEKGLNDLTVEEFIKNRDTYLDEGRSAEGSKAQKRFREQVLQDRIESNIEQGMSPSKAKIEAIEYLKDKAALHDPDQIAGGKADNITGLGDSRVNSSIGSQWKTKIKTIDEAIRKQAENMTTEQKQKTKLNVKLLWE